MRLLFKLGSSYRDRQSHLFRVGSLKAGLAKIMMRRFWIAVEGEAFKASSEVHAGKFAVRAVPRSIPGCEGLERGLRLARLARTQNARAWRRPDGQFNS